MSNKTYDKLVALGRTWIPIIAAVLAIVSGAFTQLSSVPGLEAAAPWMIAVAGVLSAVAAGLNKILKISKDIYLAEKSDFEKDDESVANEDAAMGPGEPSQNTD